jgi:hypothetical protein
VPRINTFSVPTRTIHGWRIQTARDVLRSEVLGGAPMRVVGFAMEHDDVDVMDRTLSLVRFG